MTLPTLPRARWSGLALLALTAWLAVAPAEAAPKAELWERWTAHDPASSTVVDHRAWDALLAGRVVQGTGGVALVRYGRFGAAERQALDGYLAALQAVAVSRLNRDEQFAYWVNLYNALTVKVILDNYPVETIRDIDISPGLFSNGPWGAELVEVEGEALSLDDIEHRILRPIWQDPRIHYAVNCASIGCPDLRATAWTAEGLDAALDEAARRYVNHPRGADVRGGRLYVSSIYDWFEEDFGDSEAGVIAHLRQYAASGLKNRLVGIRDIEDDEYDWTLNDAAPRPRAEPRVRRGSQTLNNGRTGGPGEGGS